VTFLRACSLALCSVALVAQDPSLDSLREEGRWKQLRPRIEGWYRLKPEDPYALLWMSRMKQAFGDPEAALELARKAAAMKSTDSTIQAQLGMAAGEAAGRADGMMKQYSLAKEMKKALEGSLVANPSDEDAAQYLLQFYLQAPGIIGGSDSKAKELAQRFTQLKPVAGLLMQAGIAFRAKDLEGGRALIQQALAKEPRSDKAHLAMTTYHLGQKPQALDATVACCRKVLEANPKEIQAHALMASILAEQGKWAELDGCLAQARRVVPDNLLPYYVAGRNLIDENKFLDKAEPLLRTYLSQEPEGNSPDFASVHWRLGKLFEKQGRRADAIKEIEQALTLRPKFKSAQKDLERLKKG